MSKGISLHIGLNFVDPKHYAGWNGELGACEMDADDMNSIAIEKGFKSKVLLTSKATIDRVSKEIKSASKLLVSGDIFFMTYSGHGGTIPDITGDEIDNQDETWCLYDAQLIDDKLNHLLSSFALGVRVIVLSDSCHSGTVVREAFIDNEIQITAKYRSMPNSVARRTYRKNRDFYSDAQNVLGSESKEISASVILISGCQDNQFSLDGVYNGLFTGKLLHVLNSTNFNVDYNALHKAILNRMPPTQSPNIMTLGKDSSKFTKENVFTI